MPAQAGIQLNLLKITQLKKRLACYCKKPIPILKATPLDASLRWHDKQKDANLRWHDKQEDAQPALA